MAKAAGAARDGGESAVQHLNGVWRAWRKFTKWKGRRTTYNKQAQGEADVQQAGSVPKNV